jgi:hypothetical protein
MTYHTAESESGDSGTIAAESSGRERHSDCDCDYGLGT